MTVSNKKWYVGSSEYSNVAAWAASTAYTVGQLIRQLTTPAVGNERVYVCTAAGTSAASEGTWTVTKGASKTSGGATFRECTGQAALNGDNVNTPVWVTSFGNRTLGEVIQNTAKDHYFIVTTSGTGGTGSEPSWNTTAGATTVDNGATWTCLGPVGNFTTPFAAPHARIDNAENSSWGGSAGASPPVFFISSTHSQTVDTTTTNIICLGSASALAQYLSVSSAAAPPTTLTAGASISGTPGATKLRIGSNGGVFAYNYIYGLTLLLSDSTAGDTLAFGGYYIFMENCTVNLSGSGSGSIISIGPDQNAGFRVYAKDTKFQFGATSQYIQGYVSATCLGELYIEGGSIAAAGAAPSTMMDLSKNQNIGPFLITLRDVDLSGVTGNLFNINSDSPSQIYVENCRLGSGVTPATGTLSGQKDSTFRMHNCDNGTKNYRFFYKDYMGTIQQETTTVLTNGASDGLTTISWNCTTTANAGFGGPLITEEFTIFNSITGVSMTATVEIAGASALNTNDMWLEIEYLGNASYPLGSTVSSRGNPPAFGSPTAIPTSTASWAGSPVHTQKLQCTFTPQMAGPIKARVFMAVPSTTEYMNPVIALSVGENSTRQYLIPGWGYINERSVAVINQTVNRYLTYEGDQ